ncbi:MAG: hypothetical protein HQL41_15930 [Alphaproteobacteria bacterium]|nr:hypothetical protein [Alphaproteobacteria bacterium]
MVTEIYSCLPGQKLKEGKLDYSDDIEDKESAEVDAKRRVTNNPALEKVAYYKVSEDGRFKVIYSYTNPKPAKGGSPKRAAGGAAPRPKAQAKPKVEKKGLIQTIKGWFG